MGACLVLPRHPAIISLVDGLEVLESLGSLAICSVIVRYSHCRSRVILKGFWQRKTEAYLHTNDLQYCFVLLAVRFPLDPNVVLPESLHTHKACFLATPRDLSLIS